jgi:membrane-bound lytic murein transglycosylase B
LVVGAATAVAAMVIPVTAAAQEPSAAPVQEPPSAPAPSPPPVATEQASERPPFPDWLKGVREEAIAAGISAATVDAAFNGLEPLPIVVERDRTQAEFTLSLDQYLERRLTKKLVQDTIKAATAHKALLAKVSAKYDVPAPVVVAVWALESNLGRFAGVRPTIATLATLAWDGRRAGFFRSQLLDALRILDRGDIEASRLKGSWAGAMGQVQFMPSSYLQYAQDFDGDGRRDIWTSQADVFASIANYLREHGWKDAHGWGREVRLPSDQAAIEAAAPRRTEGCRAEQELSTPLPLDQWRTLGARTTAGGPLPKADVEASLLLTGTRAFLLYPDYEALLRYNCAHAYALSVSLLSDRVRSGKAPAAAAQTTKAAPPKPATKSTPTSTGKKAPAAKAPAKPASPSEPKETRPKPPV